MKVFAEAALVGGILLRLKMFATYFLLKIGAFLDTFAENFLVFASIAFGYANLSPEVDLRLDRGVPLPLMTSSA
jgi:hypothetical protein